jgi:hypothetical protein
MTFAAYLLNELPHIVGLLGVWAIAIGLFMIVVGKY